MKRLGRLGLIGLAAGLVLGLGLLSSAVALAAAPGSFSPTASMETTRDAPAAAPLPGGLALVAGGEADASSFLASAEVFDPATGTFIATGSMGTARFAPAGAPLADGRVLVAGGSPHPPSFLKTAELFSPATDTFSPTGSMGVARFGAAAAPLAGGRVLVTGGTCVGAPSCPGSGYLASAEIYDPATGAFSPTGSMATARYGPAAAPLPDGRVLVVGGTLDGGGTILSSAEIYDPGTGAFSPTGSMGTARYAPAAAPLPDGRVLVTGGSTGGGSVVSSAEIFDPATATFSPTGFMGAARYGPAAAPLGDGRVLVAGGAASSSTILSSAEIFTLAPPSNALSVTVRGRTLLVGVQVPGTISVSQAPGKQPKLAALAAKRNRGKISLRFSSAPGAPPVIAVPLRLAGPALRKLKIKGKVRVRASISFTPNGGGCAAIVHFTSCYSSKYAAAQTAALKIKKGKRRKKS